ncbi:MAG: hypothetical protein Q9213_006839 [Squamulea squamosa]
MLPAVCVVSEAPRDTPYEHEAYMDDQPSRDIAKLVNPDYTDIHKALGVGIEDDDWTACKREDLRVRGLPTWSSPLPDLKTFAISFKFRTSSRYLDFLSLFLTGSRQVDIGFDKRHALLTFLMVRLEESYERYARRKFPKEFDYLQMFSADEFELQVWAAFMRIDHAGIRLSGRVRDNDWTLCDYYDKVIQIRHFAVHRASSYRWNFDTSLIRCAAACAYDLRDDSLLQQMETIIKVIYHDAGGRSKYTVTDEERQIAHDLLWPKDRRIQTSHQLLDKIQNLMEVSSYQFCLRHLPKELVAYGCNTAEHFEIHQWQYIIQARRHSLSMIGEEDEAFLENIDQTLPRSQYVREVRNSAAHRERYQLGGVLDETPKLASLVKTAVAYTRALGDGETALQIERLGAQVIPSLKKKYEDWLDPAWCDGRDLENVERSINKRIADWTSYGDWFYNNGKVEVKPIKKLYGLALFRLFDMEAEIRKLQGPIAGVDDDIPTSLEIPPQNSSREDHPEDSCDAGSGNQKLIDGEFGDEAAMSDFPCDEEELFSPSEDGEEEEDETHHHQQANHDDWGEVDLAHMASGSAADRRIAVGDWGGEANDTPEAEGTTDHSASSSLSRDHDDYESNTSSASYYSARSTWEDTVPMTHRALPRYVDIDDSDTSDTTDESYHSAQSTWDDTHDLDQEDSDTSSTSTRQSEEHHDTDRTTPSPPRSTGNRGVDDHTTPIAKPDQEDTDTNGVRPVCTNDLSMKDDVADLSV